MHTFRLKKVFEKGLANVRIWSSKLYLGVIFIPLEEFYANKELNFLLSSALTLIKNSCLGSFLELWHKVLKKPWRAGKKCFTYSYSEGKRLSEWWTLFFWGFEKVLKMQASVICNSVHNYYLVLVVMRGRFWSATSWGRLKRDQYFLRI